MTITFETLDAALFLFVKGGNKYVIIEKPSEVTVISHRKAFRENDKKRIKKMMPAGVQLIFGYSSYKNLKGRNHELFKGV